MKCQRCDGTGRTNIGVSKDDIIMDDGKATYDGKVPCDDCEGSGDIDGREEMWELYDELPKDKQLVWLWESFGDLLFDVVRDWDDDFVQEEITRLKAMLITNQNHKSQYGKCPECGKQLTEDDAYGHDCEV